MGSLRQTIVSAFVGAIVRELGLGGLIASAVLALATGALAFVAQLQPLAVAVVLGCIAAAAALLAINALVAMLYHRGVIHPPYRKAWENVQAPCVWQIAWLWIGLEPHPAIEAGSPAYPILQMLKADMESGLLPGSKSEGIWARISRNDLIAYAEWRSTMPRFLAPHGTAYRVSDQPVPKQPDPPGYERI